MYRYTFMIDGLDIGYIVRDTLLTKFENIQICAYVAGKLGVYRIDCVLNH